MGNNRFRSVTYYTIIIIIYTISRRDVTLHGLTIKNKNISTKTEVNSKPTNFVGTYIINTRQRRQKYSLISKI